MSDSTIGIIIEKEDKGDKLAIAVADVDEDGKTADIFIDTQKLHFSLTLPVDVLKELVEKAQGFLGKNEFKMIRERTESEKVAVHVEG